jgi:hypothetical protein
MRKNPFPAPNASQAQRDGRRAMVNEIFPFVGSQELFAGLDGPELPQRPAFQNLGSS